MAIPQEQFIQQLKDNATQSEKAFKLYLEQVHPKLPDCLQHPIEPYIVDFYFPDINLVLELDGSSHDDKTEYDSKRDAYLEEKGYNIIHARNHVAQTRPQDIIDTIKHAANQLKETYQEADSYYVRDIERYTEKLTEAKKMHDGLQKGIDVMNTFLEAL